MLKTMLRDLLAHKGRVVMTLLAIALGVAATVASWVVSDSVATTLAVKETRTGVDLSVQGTDTTPQLSSAERDRLGALPGVTEATGVLTGRAGLVGPDGKLVETETVLDRAGTNWDDTGRLDLVGGRTPAGPGEVALGKEDAAKARLAVGDTARILLSQGRSDTVKVVGLFGYTTLGPQSGDAKDETPAVAYAGPTALEKFGDEFSRVELTTAPGADPQALKQAVTQVVGTDDMLVSTGPELAKAATDEANDDAFEMRLTLLPFAAITLLVGMFVIANTFSMLVTQRVRQFALLRAVGANRRQVRTTVVLEAATLGLVGGTLGCLIGVALGPLMFSAMRPQDPINYTVSATPILLGYGVAVIVTVLAAYNAARKAASVPPTAALRVDATVPRDVLRQRTVIGLVLIAVSIIGVLATANPSADNLPRIIGLSSAVLGAAGVLLTAPVLVVLLFRPLTKLIARFGGPALRLGVRNAARDPRRTAGTATAITIGLSLICAFGIVGSTFAGLITSTTRANVPTTTTVLQPAAGGDSVLAESDMAALRGLPEVSSTAGSRDKITDISYEGGATRRKISAIEPEALGTVLTPKMNAGSTDLRKGVVVSQNQADMLGLKTGDPITLELEPRSPYRTTVIGVYDATELQASIFYDVAHAPASLQSQINTIYTTGEDPGAVRESVTAAFAERPDVTITDREGLVQQGVDKQRVAFVLMYAMFGVAVVIAVFGVVNTLALSVMERTREIGVLRAVGAGQPLVRRAIRAEGVVISLFGALLGLVVGTGVGAVMQHAMFGQQLWFLTVPFGLIVLCLAGIVVAATVAAVWPARNAARTDILDAIATA